MIKFDRNYYDNLSPPSYILCKANDSRIGNILCTQKKYTSKFNQYDEIEFTTYLYNDGIKNKLYDRIKELQCVELPSIGRFIIGKINTTSEGTIYENKQCVALSSEIVMAQKYLENFVINMGTVESIDNVSLYNLADPSKSLIHLVLEKCPDWSIGHIDNELMSIQRCFEINRTDIYSFLTKDIENAFECIISFDTLHYRINIYAIDNAGQNTNIHVSYNNLLKNANISSDVDKIKTVLTVTGADDLNLREVNMGYDRIINLDYFHSLEYMSQGLFNSYTLWKKKWEINVKPYENLVTQYQSFYNQMHELESVKMPDNPESTDWSLYGLNPLQEKLDSYKQRQALMIKKGQGNPSDKDYLTVYIPCCNTIDAITAQIKIVEKQIQSIKAQQDTISKQMNNIISSISIPNNFTQNQMSELSKFLREDELSSDNFVVTDSMTDSERMDMLHEMLEYGQKELAKVCQPTLSFSADMANIFAIKEFNESSLSFEPGNYIHITIRDDYIVKARLLTMTIDFLDKSNFNVTFGNLMKKKDSSVFADITEALRLAQSASTSVSMNASNWNQSNKSVDSISKMLSDGLLAAGQSLWTSKSDVQIDDNGVLISNMPDSKYPNDRIFIGNSQILFSDDALRSIKTALGRVQYTKKGVTYNDFGLLAQFVIAGYVAGSVIEGTEIIGGTITGSDFNNGNGTFHVDKNGKLLASSADITGNINANSGTIGGKNGFTITSGKLYSGNKSSLESANSGVHIGSDGIALGPSSPFKVTPDGKFISTSGAIGGWTISSNKLSASGIEIYSGGYLRATNGNWIINADGTATFKNVHISGVQSGSTFGSIGYNGSNTYGNFSGPSYFGSNVGNPFSGTCVTHIQSISADHIYANYIRGIVADIDDLYADYANINNLVAGKASVEQLNAVSANLTSLIADKATIAQLNAVNGRFDSIDAGSIKTGTMSVNRINFSSKGVDWISVQYISDIETSEETIAGVTFLAPHRISIKHLYTLGSIS